MRTDFLICSERSGSNFISRLLNAHPEICSPAPKHIFNPLLRNLYRYEPLKDKGRWKELVSDVINMMNVDFTYWKKVFSIEEIQDNVKTGDIKHLLDFLFESEALAHNKDHLFIKENKLYEFFPFLLLHYPESKYVFLVRDPRDMALSWKKNPTHPGGVVAAARQWKEDQQQSLKNAQLLNLSKKVITVHYEELISNTEAVIKEVVEFLGLHFEEMMLNYYNDELTQKNATLQPAWENLSKNVMTENFNKYRNELSEQEIKIIEKICYFEMKFLGYPPEYSWKELQNLSNSDIRKAEDEDLIISPQVLTKGVKENIAAKTVFYQKEIN